jgi:hypothetical protein
MSIPPISWSHPPSHAIAKGRLIGRGRYHLRPGSTPWVGTRRAPVRSSPGNSVVTGVR